MRILAIDTSTLFGSVALCDGGRLVAEEQQGVELTHSERLLATIGDLMTVSGWNRKSVEGVAVAIGPGSFTGLRIGLATAKGIALGLKVPIAGVSSLLTLAYNGTGSEKTVVAIIDARRGEVYAAAYAFNNGKPECVLKETVLPPEELVKKLKEVRGDMLLTGDGVVTYEKIFAKGLKGRAEIRAGELKFPHASNLARIAADSLERGGHDIVKLVPEYLRRSDAEIGFGGKK